jgi:CRISPR-associated protein Cmr3
MAAEKVLLELEPLDTVFFRDARPMQAGAGSGGHGASWPLPTVVHEALRTALLRRSGRLPKSRSERGHHRPNRSRQRWIATRDFESLRVLGPLPLRDGVLYLPRPADVVPRGEKQVVVMAPLAASAGRSSPAVAGVDLCRDGKHPGHGASPEGPGRWLRGVAAVVEPSKDQAGAWVSLADFLRLIRSGPGETVELPAVEDLWDTEFRIGIEVDPETRTAAEGKFYTAEHLRLREGVRLWLAAELSPVADRREAETARLQELAGAALTLGGESRQCRVRASRAELAVEPPPLPAEGPWGIRWVLATPAVFEGGWRPGWVCAETGAVCLVAEVPREPGESRLDWRLRIRKSEPVRARLVAVCSGKPIAFSGWEVLAAKDGADESAKNPGPKPTRLAVPAGSVYYFEAESRQEAEALVRVLHGRTRSDRFGEKGMGLGFCGTWKPLELPFLNGKEGK